MRFAWLPLLCAAGLASAQEDASLTACERLALWNVDWFAIDLQHANQTLGLLTDREIPVPEEILRRHMVQRAEQLTDQYDLQDRFTDLFEEVCFE